MSQEVPSREGRGRPRISVLVCTYRRPRGLSRLLASLARQAEAPRFEIVVVDNDASGSARPVVAASPAAEAEIRYQIEPVQNIARARNRALAETRGELIAFIDDDEIASECWLAELAAALTEFRADGAFGPVHPEFQQPPPRWIREAGVFAYQPLANGARMRWERTRTSNALVSRAELLRYGGFAESLGLVGGEDVALFKRMLDGGCHFVAAAHAPVTETIPPYRTTLRWLLQRHYRYGMNDAAVSYGTSRLPARARHTARHALHLAYWLAATAARLLSPTGRALQPALCAAAYAGQIAWLLGLRYEEYRRRRTTE